MKAKYLLTGMVILFAIGILVGLSYAKITPENVVGMWLFDEEKGQEVMDSSGNEHNGTVKGLPVWAAGKSGSALTFNGSNSYVDCGNAPNLSLNAFSVTFWVNIPNTQGWNHMVSKGFHKSGNPGAVNWGVMMVSNEESILFEVFNDTAWNSLRADGISLNQWHHVGATYDGDVAKLYVDGEEKATASGVDIKLEEMKPLFIGCQSHEGGPSHFFSGTIDEVGYFSVALAAEDIQNIMNNGLEEAIAPESVSSSGKHTTTWGALKVD